MGCYGRQTKGRVRKARGCVRKEKGKNRMRGPKARSPPEDGFPPFFFESPKLAMMRRINCMIRTKVSVDRTMRREKGEDVVPKREDLIGARVRIIGGIYRHGSPVGTVVGMTRCYVDVEVPQLDRQVRVRKTSVASYDDRRERKKFASIISEEPQIVGALVAVCTLLGRRGVQKGDKGLHEAVDRCLDGAKRQDRTSRKWG
jgi:hypothetical protein